MYISHNSISSLRKNFLIVLFTLFFMVLIGRLYFLQIVKGPSYKGIAETNRVRVLPIEAPRGIIYDRKGQIVADNKSQYNVNVIPYELKQAPKADSLLSAILGMTTAQINARIKHNWRGQFIPIKIAEDVDFKVVTSIEEHRLDLPGVIYSLEPVRSFPTRARLSQSLGYVREVAPTDLTRPEFKEYKQGDFVGWKGVERQYETVLRGGRGYNFVQVDAFGREIGRLEGRDNIPPIPGNDLFLTIDLDLQIFAESLVEGHKAGIVVLDANNGEILSIVSKPDYPPELFAGVVPNNVWSELLADTSLPMFNRATQGTYPPGSTFKMIAVLTALETKAVDPEWSVRCYGQYRLGRRVFKCWEPRGHGKMAMHDAIVNSCNVYFYNLIRRLDLNEWANMGKIFKFGVETGVDIFGESAGVMPDVDFLNRKYGEHGWTDGNKLNLVIGQGDILVTPLQMARFSAALATRGKLVQPHIGFKYIERKTNRTFSFAAATDSIQSISLETWEFIEEAMNEVVDKGTGRAARVRKASVYGKTGTSQNPHGEAHAWFIGHLKEPHQTIAIAVLVEHGKSGGGIAARIAGKIFNFIHQQNLNQMIASNAPAGN
ncbi:MAG: penicillin-binding protein 2 [Candidatus Marinimicrobia bacterium]|jgi:penicillin-binding protein 2|nr:penicillin-binding protein 2 [Candidatus Neomarinimicrobiota bacterium]